MDLENIPTENIPKNTSLKIYFWKIHLSKIHFCKISLNICPPFQFKKVVFCPFPPRPF